MVSGNLFRSAFVSVHPRSQNIKEYRIKFFKKINKSVFSHITFHLENYDQKSVNFNGETISFPYQLVKI